MRNRAMTIRSTSIADDGSVMTSGASFRVSPMDQSDAMFWFAADDV
jgi:hypothetical protein